MTNDEFELIYKKIQAQYQADMAALLRFWEMANPGIPAPKKVFAVTGNKASSIMQEALDAVVEADFTLEDLVTAAGVPLRKSTVFRFLCDRVKDGYLEVVKRGSGRRANLYRLARTTPEQTTTDENMTFKG